MLVRIPYPLLKYICRNVFWPFSYTYTSGDLSNYTLKEHQKDGVLIFKTQEITGTDVPFTATKTNDARRIDFRNIIVNDTNKPFDFGVGASGNRYINPGQSGMVYYDGNSCTVGVFNDESISVASSYVKITRKVGSSDTSGVTGDIYTISNFNDGNGKTGDYLFIKDTMSSNGNGGLVELAKSHKKIRILSAFYMDSGGTTLRIKRPREVFVTKTDELQVAGYTVFKFDDTEFIIPYSLKEGEHEGQLWAIGIEPNEQAEKAALTINDSTPQTSALLNTAYPVGSYPIGTTVTNLDVTEKYIYTRVSDTLWRRSELMTDI